MLQEISLVYKKNKLADLTMSSRFKTVNSVDVIQTIDAYPVSHIQGVSGEVGLCQASVFHHLQEFGKSIRQYRNLLHVIKILEKGKNLIFTVGKSMKQTKGASGGVMVSKLD